MKKLPGWNGSSGLGGSREVPTNSELVELVLDLLAKVPGEGYVALHNVDGMQMMGVGEGLAIAGATQVQSELRSSVFELGNKRIFTYRGDKPLRLVLHDELSPLKRATWVKCRRQWVEDGGEKLPRRPEPKHRARPTAWYEVLKGDLSYVYRWVDASGSEQSKVSWGRVPPQQKEIADIILSKYPVGSQVPEEELFAHLTNCDKHDFPAVARSVQSPVKLFKYFLGGFNKHDGEHSSYVHRGFIRVFEGRPE